MAPPERGSNLLQTNIQNNRDNRNNYHYGDENSWRNNRDEWDRGHDGRDGWCAPLIVPRVSGIFRGVLGFSYGISLWPQLSVILRLARASVPVMWCTVS